MMSIGIAASPSFRASAARFRETDRIAGATLKRLTESSALAAKNMARAELKDLVYNRGVESLRSVAPNGRESPQHYLARRRTGLTWNAIKVEKTFSMHANSVSAKVFVDPDDFQGYMYAITLNKGAQGINYEARPFWTNMQRKMAPRYFAEGRVALKTMATALRGGRAAGHAFVSVQNTAASGGELDTTVSAQGSASGL